MCSINVSVHYFREWGERSLVGLAGVALRPGEALQSGETCVRAAVLHRGLVVEDSLV